MKITLVPGIIQLATINQINNIFAEIDPKRLFLGRYPNNNKRIEGSAGFRTLTEEFTNVDNEKYVKDAEVIEAGYLDLGFTYYRVRFEIIEKGDDSSVIKTTVDYDVKEEAAANVSYVNDSISSQC